jgi:hypothetical protein
LKQSKLDAAAPIRTSCRPSEDDTTLEIESVKIVPL